MINRTFSLYKNAYSGLSPSTWLLSSVMLINRSGTMVLPFMTIYLTSPNMGYSVGKAGFVMGLFGLGAVTGSYVGGKLTDRIGFYPVMLTTLLGGGLLFMIVGQLKSYPLICIFTFLLSFVNDAFRPANSTAVIVFSKEENRTRSYGLHRLAVNLGWAVGNTLGGFLAAVNYELLFWVDGCTNIFAALLLWYFLRPSRAQKVEKKEEAPADPRHSPYRDKIYLWFILLVTLFAANFFQVMFYVNPYYKIVHHFPEQIIGVIGALNGIMIAVFEMVLVYKLEGRRSSLYFVVRGVMLVGISYLLLNIFQVNYLVAFTMTFVWTFGEMLAMPFMNTFWTSRSASHNRGQYAALYSIGWSVAQTAGPLAGGYIVEHTSWAALWWISSGTCFVTALGFLWLQKNIHRSSLTARL